MFSYVLFLKLKNYIAGLQKSWYKVSEVSGSRNDGLFSNFRLEINLKVCHLNLSLVESLTRANHEQLAAKRTAGCRGGARQDTEAAEHFARESSVPRNPQGI